PIKVLACGHTYRKTCYNNNGFKCLLSLILTRWCRENIQSLLERLQRFNEEYQVEEPDNDICDDNDENGSVEYTISTLEEALKKFKLQ
ncbi:8353_t:CDS:1, partial [Ambispora gerdemannii]